MNNVQSYLDSIGKIVGAEVDLFILTWGKFSESYVQAQSYTKLRDDQYSALPVSLQNSYGVTYIIKRKDNAYGYVTQFSLSGFAGQCALCISHSVVVDPKFHQKGINTIGIKLREELAYLAGYSGLICTDLVKSIPTERTLTGAKFGKVFTVKNRRTKNDIAVYVKNIRRDGV